MEEEANWKQKQRKAKYTHLKDDDEEEEALNAINKEYQKELQGLNLEETILKEQDIEEEIQKTLRNLSLMDTNQFDYREAPSI